MLRLTLTLLWMSVLTAVILGCTPDYKNKDPNIRKAAVEKITDQALLGKIVYEDKDKAVREAAFLRLTDQTLLKKIATEPDADVPRASAVFRLTDHEVLESIIVDEKQPILIRQLANRRLEMLGTGANQYTFH